MRFVTIPAFLNAVPALGDYGQTSRCYTLLDSPSKNFVPAFLQNGSRCASYKEGFAIIDCASMQIPKELISLLSPLVHTIRSWERFYQTDINSAFQKYGKGKNMKGNVRPGVNSRNFLSFLVDYWKLNAGLCFYDNSPQVTDRLAPREAGLLNLFFVKGDVRAPILKIGVVWQYNSSAICAAEADLDRLRQARAIAEMVPQAWQARPVNFEKMWKEDREQYRDTYSTDPFLQGVITGWQHGRYSCPGTMDCRNYPDKAKMYLPTDRDDFIKLVADMMRRGEKVCVVFGDSPLADDTYYIAASKRILPGRANPAAAPLVDMVLLPSK